ncbi:MAG: TetR/AcrR family transcriptional regulator, partial [Chloroflexota bacterium]
MCDREFDTITVTDLVKAAKVGRATFYRNFDTIEDVLRLRCDQVCEGLVEYYIAYQQQHGAAGPMPRLKPMLRYFDTHSDMIEMLMQANHLDMLATAFRKEFEPYISWPAVEGEYVGYGLTIRIGVAISILAYWIETGKQQTPDELADKLSMMIQGMVMHNQLP